MKEKLQKLLRIFLSIGILFGIWYFIIRDDKKPQNQIYPNKYPETEYKEERVSTESIDAECGYNDGIHTATVDYYNPETGHAATYDLEVEVENCEVTTIFFPKGGWLDNTHITPEEIDNNGNASIVDDRGRTFDVHIDD